MELAPTSASTRLLKRGLHSWLPQRVGQVNRCTDPSYFCRLKDRGNFIRLETPNRSKACALPQRVLPFRRFFAPRKSLDHNILTDSNKDGTWCRRHDSRGWLRHHRHLLQEDSPFCLGHTNYYSLLSDAGDDGVASHMSGAIDQAAAEYGVVLIYLSPESNLLFQPLNVGVFKSV